MATQAAELAQATSGPVAQVAKRYASALFDLAVESNAVEAVEREMSALRRAFAASKDFRSFLASPIQDSEARARAISAIADNAKFSHLTRNFLGLVARNRRLFALDAMAAAFMQRAAAERGEIGAEAVSASPLSDDQFRRLRSEIERMVGKAVNLQTRVDSEILGGLVVKVGSTMIDSSLKTKLNRLKSVMKRA